MLSNPHKNPLRNAKKKLDSVLSLKDKPTSSLDEGQLAKLRTEKKLLTEIRNLEQKMQEWDEANGGVVDVLNSEIAASTGGTVPEKKSAPVSKKNEKKEAAKPVAMDAPTPILTGDKEKDKKIRNLTKKIRAIEELKNKKKAGQELDADQLKKIATEASVRELLKEVELSNGTHSESNGTSAKKEKKKADKCEAAAPSKAKVTKKEEKPKSAAPHFFGDEESAASLMEPREEKTLRNRMKNLNKKLESISQLKKNKEALTSEQLAKVESEKDAARELAEIIDKLTAFGKM